MPLEVIILAAGKGTRMRSTKPKVLLEVGAKPMLRHVIDAALTLHPSAIHIVIGHGGDELKMAMENELEQDGIDHQQLLSWARQLDQLGTGHAVSQAMPSVDEASDCLLLNGDVPLVDSHALQLLCTSSAPLAILTAKPDDTQSLGRIIRNDDGKILGIVEHHEATHAERQIDEINTGIMYAKASHLRRWLGNLGNENSKGEYYLTDIIAAAVSEQIEVGSVLAEDADRWLGVNSKIELAKAERKLQEIRASQLMQQGITLMDPARTDIRGSITAGEDCVIDINCIFIGTVVLGNGCRIGPNCVVEQSVIGDDCAVYANSVIEQSQIGDNCNIGPFARIRPETTLADHVRIGNFVETKKSEIGYASKVNHLSYVGDSSVGENVNIGAGVITCNYDGANKHRTEIGDDVFVGSDSQLVAPVKIAAGATIGAGATITKNVAENTLVITRAPLKSMANWNRPKKKK